MRQIAAADRDVPFHCPVSPAQARGRPGAAERHLAIGCSKDTRISAICGREMRRAGPATKPGAAGPTLAKQNDRRHAMATEQASWVIEAAQAVADAHGLLTLRLT